MNPPDVIPPAAGPRPPLAVPTGHRWRDGAMMLTLAVGIPLVLAWFGLVGWGVLWLAWNALSL